ncbi:MAG TPA: adenylyl cyclase, partial [Arthrobacter sp.]|nr:adenylyl cyclase [Arthrobacter sp.]
MPLAHFRLRPGVAQPRLRRPLRLHSRLFAGSVAVLLGVLATGAGAATAADASAPAKPAPAQPQPAKAKTSPAPEFGPNVRIFDPSMPVAEIQATVDAIAAAQVDDEMGSKRYSLLFKPGTYGT